MSTYALLSYFAQPTVFLYVALGMAIAWNWRKHPESRRGLRGIVFFYLALIVFALPASEHLLLGTLEQQNPPLDETYAKGDVIVVLSGDVFQPDVMRPKAEPGPSTLYRCVHAADLYRANPCPVIISGATSDPDREDIGCAVVMNELLVKLGIKPSDLIVENASFSTFENAVACSKIIREKKFQKVVLVTDAVHMPRAVRCFRAQGLEVIPSGCQYRSAHVGGELDQFLPRLEAAKWIERACHEWQGILWYWLQGRI